MMSTQMLPSSLPGSTAPPVGLANERINMDTPPFSRVFVVCTKNHRETDIRAAFQEYGVIEDVWMVKVSTLISVTIIDANCR